MPGRAPLTDAERAALHDLATLLAEIAVAEYLADIEGDFQRKDRNCRKPDLRHD